MAGPCSPERYSLVTVLTWYTALKYAPATLVASLLIPTTFIIKDPNEEWDLPNRLIIIDTIHGIKKITVFTSLKDFSIVPRLTMHDFDLLTNLRWLAKLNKLPPFTIIGLPKKAEQAATIKKITAILKDI